MLHPAINFTKLLSAVIALLVISGCSTLSKSDDPEKHISADPFEGFNRKVYAFNDVADKAVLRPVARVYDAALPDPAQRSVGRFFSNLGEPLSIINNLLQGKVEGALHSSYRFVVNSTLGLFGFFDVAKSYEVEERREDFGQTFAAWGAGPGPFIMIPFLGPANVRDGVGRIGGFTLDPVNNSIDDSATETALTVVSLINLRASFLGTDEVLDQQLDPYLFLKTAYETNRIDQIYDGDPPEQSDDDLEF